MQFKLYQNQSKIESKHQIPTLLLSALTLCLILLSACGNNPSNTSSNPSTTIPTPTIDPITKNQGDMQLLAFQQWITLMQQYNGNVTIYQQQLNTDQQTLNNAKTESTYKSALAKLNSHVDAIKIPAMKTEIKSLQNQLQQGQASWGQQHQYHDDYNNINYPLGFEYGPNGIGGWVQQEFDSAQTLTDYQQTIEDLNMYLTNFQAMTTNAADNTPYNQVHQTDLQLLQHYGYMHKKVVIVSLYEQAMRVYQNGKLVKAFRSPQDAQKGQALLEHGGLKANNLQPCLRHRFHSLHLIGTLTPQFISPCSTTATATSCMIVGGVQTMALAQISHTRTRAVMHSLHTDLMVVLTSRRAMHPGYITSYPCTLPS